MPRRPTHWPSLSATTRAWHHLAFTAGLTDVYRALDTTTGLRLPNAPPIVATAGVERGFDGGPLGFGARVRVVGQTADVPNYSAPNAPPFADPYDAYTRTSATGWRTGRSPRCACAT